MKRLTTMEYAIETIGLVKRYPTSVRRERGGLFFGGFHGGGRVDSFGGIIGVLRGMKGPFIEALRGVDLKIKNGEIFGVLGPNGAGKTTLIKILCTLVIHDEGEAYVHGFDVKKEPDGVLKNLQAVLPESRGFAWRLTGLQNLEFYALLYGLREKEAKERINYLLELTGLKERAHDGYQRYSTGMQRKLLLCRSLLRNTSTLLFDEPTAGLDPNSAAEFRSLLRDRLAREEGKTIFLSTHNLYEAQAMCDRIAILDRGKITACDTPDNIRYMMFDEKVFNITFIDAVFNDGQVKMVNELEEMPGVHGVTPEVDPERNFHGLSIRVNKNMDLSDILEVIMKSELKIRMINTKEPTLEDAFIAITSRQREQPCEFRGYRGSS
jgi:ABC-2 type transport system ATP-binding protein